MNFRKRVLRRAGEKLGGISAGALSHTYQRIQEKIERDEKLSRRVNRLYQEVTTQ